MNSDVPALIFATLVTTLCFLYAGCYTTTRNLDLCKSTYDLEQKYALCAALATGEKSHCAKLADEKDRLVCIKWK